MKLMRILSPKSFSMKSSSWWVPSLGNVVWKIDITKKVWNGMEIERCVNLRVVAAGWISCIIFIVSLKLWVFCTRKQLLWDRRRNSDRLTVQREAEITRRISIIVCHCSSISIPLNNLFHVITSIMWRAPVLDIRGNGGKGELFP